MRQMLGIRMDYKGDPNRSEKVRKDRLTYTQKVEIALVILALLLLITFWQLIIHTV
jgi:hypothetical protein